MWRRFLKLLSMIFRFAKAPERVQLLSPNAFNANDSITVAGEFNGESFDEKFTRAFLDKGYNFNKSTGDNSLSSYATHSFFDTAEKLRVMVTFKSKMDVFNKGAIKTHVAMLNVKNKNGSVINITSEKCQKAIIEYICKSVIKNFKFEKSESYRVRDNCCTIYIDDRFQFTFPFVWQNNSIGILTHHRFELLDNSLTSHNMNILWCDTTPAAVKNGFGEICPELEEVERTRIESFLN